MNWRIEAATSAGTAPAAAASAAPPPSCSTHPHGSGGGAAQTTQTVPQLLEGAVPRPISRPSIKERIWSALGMGRCGRLGRGHWRRGRPPGPPQPPQVHHTSRVRGLTWLSVVVAHSLGMTAPCLLQRAGVQVDLVRERRGDLTKYLRGTRFYRGISKRKAWKALHATLPPVHTPVGPH